MKNILSIATLAAIVGATAAPSQRQSGPGSHFETTTTGFYYGVGNNEIGTIWAPMMAGRFEA